MGLLSSLPPMPDFMKCLHLAWMDPHQPHHKISCRAMDLGWETLWKDIMGQEVLLQFTHHPFSGNYTCKFDHHDSQVEAALGVQPLPRMNEGPHHLGHFTAEDPYSEVTPFPESPALGATRDHSPNVAPLPTPPVEPHSTILAAKFRATSMDLDASPSAWREISLDNETPRPTDPTAQHSGCPWPSVTRSPGLQALSKSISSLGKNLRNTFKSAQNSEA
jgi:hypothetical protein